MFGEQISIGVAFGRITPARIERSDSQISVRIDGICATKVSAGEKPSLDDCGNFRFGENAMERAEKLAGLLRELTLACKK